MAFYLELYLTKDLVDLTSILTNHFLIEFLLSRLSLFLVIIYSVDHFIIIAFSFAYCDHQRLYLFNFSLFVIARLIFDFLVYESAEVVV